MDGHAHRVPCPTDRGIRAIKWSLAGLARIREGRRIGSMALVAVGQHARTDGLTSLGVLAGAIGVALGFDRADPLAGLAIAVVIVFVLWQAGRACCIASLMAPTSRQW